MKKLISLLMLVGMVTVGLVSCSKETLDSAGRDVALNIITTGVWEKATQTIAGNSDVSLNVTRELLDENQTLNFDKDGKAWVKTEGADTQTSFSYSMPSPKQMTFEGIDYEIKENIVQSISTLTLVNKRDLVTTTIVFKRNR